MLCGVPCVFPLAMRLCGFVFIISFNRPSPDSFRSFFFFLVVWQALTAEQMAFVFFLLATEGSTDGRDFNHINRLIFIKYEEAMTQVGSLADALACVLADIC